MSYCRGGQAAHIGPAAAELLRLTPHVTKQLLSTCPRRLGWRRQAQACDEAAVGRGHRL